MTRALPAPRRAMRPRSCRPRAHRCRSRAARAPPPCHRVLPLRRALLRRIGRLSAASSAPRAQAARCSTRMRWRALAPTLTPTLTLTLTPTLTPTPTLTLTLTLTHRPLLDTYEAAGLVHTHPLAHPSTLTLSQHPSPQPQPHPLTLSASRPTPSCRRAGGNHRRLSREDLAPAASRRARRAPPAARRARHPAAAARRRPSTTSHDLP